MRDYEETILREQLGCSTITAKLVGLTREAAMLKPRLLRVTITSREQNIEVNGEHVSEVCLLIWERQLPKLKKLVAELKRVSKSFGESNATDD